MQRLPRKYLSAICLVLAQCPVDLVQGLKEAGRVAGYARPACVAAVRC
jgi:hypothetical protein